MSDRLHYRAATAIDLGEINDVVRQCVMTWDLPERVKRLSLGSYLYNAHDLLHLEMRVALDDSGRIQGVAAWEPAEPSDLPPGTEGILLHGLFVHPAAQGDAIGSGLVDIVVEAARLSGNDGVLVKAQADANGFFRKRGFTHLLVKDPARDYANRWWKTVGV